MEPARAGPPVPAAPHLHRLGGARRAQRLPPQPPPDRANLASAPRRPPRRAQLANGPPRLGGGKRRAGVAGPVGGRHAESRREVYRDGGAAAGWSGYPPRPPRPPGVLTGNGP